jgi:hypothetical protein
VETAGKGNLQTRNKSTKIRIESGKQVVGPISAQTLVDWRLGECGDEFIGVYTDGNIVMGAELADFFFYISQPLQTSMACYGDRFSFTFTMRGNLIMYT